MIEVSRVRALYHHQHCDICGPRIFSRDSLVKAIVKRILSSEKWDTCQVREAETFEVWPDDEQ